MGRRKSRRLALAVMLAAAFLAGGGSALLYVYLHPVNVVCLFRSLTIPNAMPLET